MSNEIYPEENRDDKRLFRIIANVKNDRSLFYNISVIFEPLLKKYAKKLGYEDAFNDLQLALFETALKMDVGKMKNASDGAIVNYINKSTIHAYYTLAKKHYSYCAMNVFFSDACEVRELDKAACDDYSHIYRDTLKNLLTKTEYDTLICHYYYGLSIDEIAKLKKVSRQYINKSKLAALKKLRDEF